MTPQSAIRNLKSENRLYRCRLEIRIDTPLLEQIQDQAAARGTTLAEWARTALIEKLLSDRRQEKWRKERSGLEALEQAIKAMPVPVAVQAKHTAQNNSVADSASVECTDNSQRSR